MNASDDNLVTKLNALDNQEQLLINHSQSVPEDTLKYLKKLEGDCRIKEHHLLKINYLKVVFLAFPFALTFIGLIILYQFEKVRLALVFSKVEINPTYIIVTSSDAIIRICKINIRQLKNRVVTAFCFQELFYEIIDHDVLPLAMRISQEIKNFSSSSYLKYGLTKQQARDRLSFYGRNEHIVKIPTFYGYMFNFLFLSFFTYIQYFTFFIYVLQNLLFYGYLIIAGSFIGTIINYYLIRKSHKKIKEIAQKQHYVEVLREGTKINIKSGELVPGDLYFPKDYIPCDSIILQKDLFVNEVGFTGENIPIGKFSLNNPSKIYESEHWAFEGSQIVSIKENCIAIVANTGYSTRKGRIIRKILNKKPQGTNLFINILQTTVISLTITLSAYFGFYKYMFDTVQDRSIPLITLGFFFVQCVPSVLPIFINFAYAMLLIRYRNNSIVCLKSQKTIESSRLETVCFDKTGTLTQNKVQIENIILFDEESQQFKATSPQQLPQNPVIHGLFATCHSVQDIDNKLYGDEIDIRMFQASKAIFTQNKSQYVIFEVEIPKAKLQVIKVNQFQSKFQSMSVLVKNTATSQFFIYAKGSPQKLHALSQIKYANFSNTIKQLSLEGYRIIAVSIRKIQDQEQVNYLKKCDRQTFLKGTVLTALVTFSNKIKQDAPQLIKTLKQAEIATKIITGDNIFVAIQTALTLQMVPLGSRVIALQGDKIEVDGSTHVVCVSKVGDKILEEELIFENINNENFRDEYLAMDLAFVKKNQDFFLENNCTVFARATPQLKAIIIKKEKERIQNNYQSRHFSSRMFGGRIRKVAMVGDGSNDLMAIRQANVGIGIIDSDAVYSSDFTITSLSQIDTIIRESKAGQQKLIQTIYYQFYFGFINIIQQVLTVHDMSIIAFIPSLFKNFGMIYFLTWFISFTPPADKLTKYCPSFNLIGPQYLITWWGSIIILAGGQAVGYFYYIDTTDFVPNPDRSSINGNNKSATITFLSTLLLSLFLFIGFASSHPFKKPLYANTPATIFLLFGFIMTTLLFFFSEKLSALQIKPIATHEAFVVYMISVATGFLIIFYAKIIRSAQLYKNQFPRKNVSPQRRLKGLSHSIV